VSLSLASRFLVALAALALCISVPASSTGAGRPPRLVVYGYVYAKHCPAAGRKEVVDRWGMYMCNCTSYVAWALDANHQRTGWFIPGSMDAWNWPNVARREGLRVGQRPSVGDVAVWPKLGRPFGHVAYVIRLDPDGRIDVSEYNFPFRNDSDGFRFDTRTHVSARGATFIEVPSR
jgi:surface antigen